jgi:membrane protein
VVGDVIGTVRRTFASFFYHQGFFLAAGLSFYFLICIIPLLFLVVSAVGFVLTRETAVAAVVAELTRNFPVYRDEIRRGLVTIVRARTVSGILGTAILILFSTQLFSAMRLVLTQVYGARGRGFIRGVLFDAVFVIALVPLFLLSMVASGLFAWFRRFVLAPANLPDPWWWLSGVAFGVGVSIVLFYLVFRYAATRLPSRRAALAGAVVTSGLWEIAKQLFRLYIREFDVYDQLYGALGALVAVVMFVYYTMVVFVLGAAYVAAVDRRLAR